MNPTASETDGSTDKSRNSDQDPKPSIPLRQRRLPASFWQEPCQAPSGTNRDITPSAAAPSTIQPFPLAYPWTMNSSSALPVVLPPRLIAPNHFLLAQNSNPQWMRSSTNCCTCATCLNYSYVIPRLPESYSLRYRSPLNVPSCPAMNCVDQSCKLCFTADHWHPDRLRHFRLRAARYNAILD